MAVSYTHLLLGPLDAARRSCYTEPTGGMLMQPIHLAKGPIAVRPLAQQDAPVLLKWMTNPLVLEFYGGRDLTYTFEKIQEEFYTLEKGARRCLVELEGNPVGYIQIYQLDAALCREYHYP